MTHHDVEDDGEQQRGDHAHERDPVPVVSVHGEGEADVQERRGLSLGCSTVASHRSRCAAK